MLAMQFEPEPPVKVARLHLPGIIGATFTGIMKAAETTLKFAIKVLFQMMLFHQILLPKAQNNPRWPEGILDLRALPPQATAPAPPARHSHRTSDRAPGGQGWGGGRWGEDEVSVVL